MTFDELQQIVSSHTQYEGRGEFVGLVVSALELQVNAGKVAQHVEQIIRKDKGIMTSDHSKIIGRQLGSILESLAEICTHAGISFDDVAEYHAKRLKASVSPQN